MIHLVDRFLCSQRWFRMLFGGLWVRRDGHWAPMQVFLVDSDGNRVLAEILPDGVISTFSELHSSIERLEDFH